MSTKESDLAHFFGDASQSEKPSKIEPPLQSLVSFKENSSSPKDKNVSRLRQGYTSQVL